MNDTDKKRLEEIEKLHPAEIVGTGFCDTCWLVSLLKESLERESGVRELHRHRWNSLGASYCARCHNSTWPCETIRILDGGEG